MRKERPGSKQLPTPRKPTPSKPKDKPSKPTGVELTEEELDRAAGGVMTPALPRTGCTIG